MGLLSLSLFLPSVSIITKPLCSVIHIRRRMTQHFFSFHSSSPPGVAATTVVGVTVVGGAGVGRTTEGM